MTDTPELKPCPFCGACRAETYYVRDGRVAMCPACGAKSGSQFNGPSDMPSADERAIATWNRRAPTPEAAEIERLQKRVAELEELLNNPAECDDGFYGYHRRDVQIALGEEPE